MKQRFEDAKKDQSSYIERKLQEYKDKKMVLCIEVCVGSALLGPFVVPACAACIAINYAGLIPKYTKQLQAQLQENLDSFSKFQDAFGKYESSAKDIKAEADAQVGFLDDWTVTSTKIRNRIAQYEKLAQYLPNYMKKIRDLMGPLKDCCQLLKDRLDHKTTPALK